MQEKSKIQKWSVNIWQENRDYGDDLTIHKYEESVDFVMRVSF